MRSKGRHALDPTPPDLAILRWIAAGYLANNDLLHAELHLMKIEGLIADSPEPMPTLTPRGRLLLQVANGECAPPLD